jgi:hypothetical protein
LYINSHSSSKICESHRNDGISYLRVLQDAREIHFEH